jgi:hypothetical protein
LWPFKYHHNYIVAQNTNHDYLNIIQFQRLVFVTCGIISDEKRRVSRIWTSLTWLNSIIMVCFLAWTNFAHCFSWMKEWLTLQVWSKVTQKWSSCPVSLSIILNLKLHVAIYDCPRVEKLPVDCQQKEKNK